MHVIRSRNRLRHENASGRAFQFPQCSPKAEFAVWRRRVLLVPPFLSPFLVYRIDSQITAHCCTVCCFGWDRQDAGGHSQLFWRQTVAGEPEPEHASEKGCGMHLFTSLRSPLPPFFSIVIALVFYQPTDALTTKWSLIGVSHVYRVVRSARSKPEAPAGSLMILTMKTTTRSEWERNGPAE